MSPLRKLTDSHEKFIDSIVDDVVAKRVAPADVTSQTGILENYPQIKDIELRKKLEGIRDGIGNLPKKFGTITTLRKRVHMAQKMPIKGP